MPQLLVSMGFRAGQTLHHDVFTKVLGAPLSWHEENPSGRITSRFSAELLRVDIMINNVSVQGDGPSYLAIPSCLLSMLTAFTHPTLTQLYCCLVMLYYVQFIDANCGMIVQTVALLVVIIVAVPPMLAVILVAAVFYCFQVKATDRGLRDIKRASNNALSPVMSNVTETLNGRMLIRAMNCEQYFVTRHEEAMDNYTRMDFASQSLLNWGNLAGGCKVLSSRYCATQYLRI